MAAADVVVQRGSSSRPARIADVVGPAPEDAASNGLVEVRWRDSDRQQLVSTMSLVRAREGSVAFHLAVDPDAVRRRYESEPVRVVAALLAGRPSTAELQVAELVRKELKVFVHKIAFRETLRGVAQLGGVATVGEGPRATYSVHLRWADPFTDVDELPPVDTEAVEESSASAAPTDTEVKPQSPLDHLTRLTKQPDAQLIDVGKALTTLLHAPPEDRDAALLVIAQWRRRRELPLDLLLAAVSRTEGARRGRARSGLLSAVADKVTAEPLTASQADSVRRAFEREEYGPSSTRRRVLMALAGQPQVSLDDQAWWRGLTLADVDDLAQETRGRAIRSEVVVQRVARPLVDQALRAASTRQQLGVLIALHRQLAELVDAAAFAAAFVRVAGADSVTARWLVTLEREDERAALAEELTRARAAAEAETRRADEAEVSAGEAVRGRERIQQLLRDVQGQVVEVSDAERRQERLEALRTAAELVVVAEESTGVRSPEEVVDSLVAELARVDVVLTDRRGTSTVYDAHRQETVGSTPERGSSVEVVRSGFAWQTGNESVVLIKSVVTSAM